MRAITIELINKAVVDTGPLFTALTLNYIRMNSAPKVKQDNILKRAGIHEEFLKSPSRRQGYLQLFHSIPIILTISQVIGELQGLQNSRLKFHGEDLRCFWLHSMDFLHRKNIDEKLLRLLDMYGKENLREGVCMIGPTDTGLIELARKEGCVLLTDDERSLAGRAWNEGVDCRLMEKII